MNGEPCDCANEDSCDCVWGGGALDDGPKRLARLSICDCGPVVAETGGAESSKSMSDRASCGRLNSEGTGLVAAA